MSARFVISSIALASLVALTGCDEKPAPAEEKKTEAAEPAAPAPEETAADKAAEKASPEEDAAAMKAAAEAAKAQAEVDENPLTECCRALGKKAFTLRDADYQGGAKACGEALQANTSATIALPAIKKALKSKPMPAECSN